VGEIAPPLTISKAEIDELIGIFALTSVTAEAGVHVPRLG
jgi:4-aminobutyrate aminotransferase-like enzyme